VAYSGRISAFLVGLGLVGSGCGDDRCRYEPGPETLSLVKAGADNVDPLPPCPPDPGPGARRGGYWDTTAPDCTASCFPAPEGYNALLACTQYRDCQAADGTTAFYLNCVYARATGICEL
jgi:hypothetical protein